MQMACFDDVGCRVITGNQAIDHATVARFVRRHRTRSPACSCRYWRYAPGRAW